MGRKLVKIAVFLLAVLTIGSIIQHSVETQVALRPVSLMYMIMSFVPLACIYE